MPKFLLYADDKPVTFFDTLDEAKSRASEFIGRGSAVRIESFVAPASSEVWRFDTEVDEWERPPMAHVRRTRKEVIRLLKKDVQEWNSWRVTFSGRPDLAGANLKHAELRHADLSRAVLTDANLTGADLSGANLRATHSSNVNLTGADLSGADLTGADLRDAIFEVTIVDVETKGLDNLTEVQKAGLKQAEERASESTRPARDLAKNQNTLRELQEALAGCVPSEDRVDGDNRDAIPLTRAHYDVLVATVSAAHAYHRVESTDSWDQRVRRVLAGLNDILKDLEAVGEQFRKTVKTWVPIAALLRRVINGLTALLENPDEGDAKEGE